MSYHWNCGSALVLTFLVIQYYSGVKTMLIIVPDIDKEQILHLLCVQYYACWPTFLLFQQWHMGILQFTEELEHPLRLLQAGKQVRKDRSVFCSFADLGLGDMCYIVFCSFPDPELGLCATLYYGLPGVGCYVLPCILLLCWPGVRCYVLHCIKADRELGVMCYTVL